MATWFTSDTHYGHANIIKYCKRPFESVVEMDQALINGWNSRVKPDDVVYHLGDVSFHRDYHVTNSILASLNGRKHLIKGNHDGRKMLNVCRRQFISIDDYVEIKHDDRLIVLSHFPFLTWHRAHRGSWHLHGHCHGNLPDDHHALRIDVGVDPMGFSPVSIEQIAEIMAKKAFSPIDHHGRDM